jgi:hypothetical protein
MSNQPERYKAYLLRMWQVNRDGEWALRASLENVHTGERRGFASLDALIEFLRQTAGADGEWDVSHSHRWKSPAASGW